MFAISRRRNHKRAAFVPNPLQAETGISAARRQFMFMFAMRTAILLAPLFANARLFRALVDNLLLLLLFFFFFLYSFLVHSF